MFKDDRHMEKDFCFMSLLRRVFFFFFLRYTIHDTLGFSLWREKKMGGEKWMEGWADEYSLIRWSITWVWFQLGGCTVTTVTERAKVPNGTAHQQEWRQLQIPAIKSVHSQHLPTTIGGNEPDLIDTESHSKVSVLGLGNHNRSAFGWASKMNTC